MRKMTSNEIRNMYLEYFHTKGHTIMPSASLLVLNDQSLLWNNAGVTPLKKYFDGSEIPVNRRMTSCQKCIRTNDIEEVGDNRHHTFFEMLGNFSIGDYFKNEAMEMSFELLTSSEYFDIPLDKLYFTVYEDDDEAYNKWISLGVEDSHIVRLKSNFWEIGEGPCGPDSEIFYDRGIKYDKDNLGIRLLSEEIDNSRYVEIWNNVFSQYNSKEGLDRSEYPELPSKNIDTGMGLERITAIMQEVESSYDTDLFKGIINKIEELSNRKYNNDKEFRIIADHIRTLTLAICDGAVFSNEGRGYVVRRLLRRAVRYGHDINIEGLFMYKLVSSVVDIMDDYYPELRVKQEYIENLIKKEEELFSTTLLSGEKKLDEMLANVKDNVFSGYDAFKLYDTYGFPYELTKEYLDDKGYTINKEEFDLCMEKQKEMARSSRADTSSMNVQSEALLNFKEESKFTYDEYELSTEVIGLIKDDKLVDSINDSGYVILKTTPFYAEMGGQVADTGVIYNDNAKLEVEDVITSPNKQNIHVVKVIEGTLNLHDKVTAKIDEKRRHNIEKNHSATHLLHAALIEGLQYEVEQAGSKVDEVDTRFDFTYPNKITDEDVMVVESLVNEKINTNEDTIIEVMDKNDAIKSGAIHKFDEKYGDVVRVVTLQSSKEFCGGTHVKNVKDINRFAIKSIESKGANVYRIEAVTDENIENELFKEIKPYNDEMIKLLKKAKEIIDEADDMGIKLDFNVEIDNSKPTSYKDIIFNRNEVSMVREKVRILEKEYYTKKEEKLLKEDNILKDFKTKNDINYVIKKVNNYDINLLKTLVDNEFNNMTNALIFVANIKDNNVNYICKSNCKLSAGELIKDASTKSNGNGGGSKTFGQGGGNDISKIDEILSNIENLL